MTSGIKQRKTSCNLFLLKSGIFPKQNPTKSFFLKFWNTTHFDLSIRLARLHEAPSGPLPTNRPPGSRPPASAGVPSDASGRARPGHSSLDTCARLSTVSCLFYPSHSAVPTGMRKLGLAWKSIFSIACCMFRETHLSPCRRRGC